jgi:putative transcriptional regulator
MNLPEFTPSAPTLQGHLLFASPIMQGGIFDHSVILLSQHSATDGAFGMILNQPTGQVVGDVLRDPMFHPLRHISIHRGGPVAENNLFFAALWWEQQDTLRVIHQISADDAIQHHKQPGTLVRAFVGYSGWSPGQLEQELERASWITATPPRELLGYSHDQSLWSTTLRGMSPYHRMLADAPRNPFAN